MPSNYYTLQLNLLVDKPFNRMFKFIDSKSKTNWMNLNKQSTKELIHWLLDNYDQMEG